MFFVGFADDYISYRLYMCISCVACTVCRLDVLVLGCRSRLINTFGNEIHSERFLVVFVVTVDAFFLYYSFCLFVFSLLSLCFHVSRSSRNCGQAASACMLSLNQHTKNKIFKNQQQQ